MGCTLYMNVYLDYLTLPVLKWSKL